MKISDGGDDPRLPVRWVVIAAIAVAGIIIYFAVGPGYGAMAGLGTVGLLHTIVK